MKVLSEFFKNKPYLAWYVADKNKLSDESVLEHTLNYGNWEDYMKIEKTLGIKKTNILFAKLSSKKRVNLRPQTVNYFSNYFAKYA